MKHEKFLCVALLAIAATFSAGCEKEYEARKKDTMKAKQVEAKINLQALVAAQAGYNATARKYGKTFNRVGFSVSGGERRYSYFMGDDVIVGRKGPRKLPEDLAPPKVSENGFTAYAVANLDNDPDLDIWRVDQSKRLKHLRNDW